MAKNDVIILDGILDDRVALKLPSDKRDEAFEFFAVEQILKDFNLSNDEISQGFTDGKDDGGIDFFFILINGNLLVDSENFYWPKSHAEIEVHVITCKHHDTFKQAPMDNMVASLTEIFNLSIDDHNIVGSYNSKLLKSRTLLKSAYRKLSSKISEFYVRMSYASRGDVVSIGDSIISRSNQLINIAKQSFGNSEATFAFFGSSELIELSRKVPNFSLELPYNEVLAKGERYVLLAQLNDYKDFITDEGGKLRRYLFNSNVRAFMGLNRVNEDIKHTLIDDNSPDFWWLNNGVTILATSAQVIGKTIHIEDIQIVNGLQTTESIYKYFMEGGLDPLKRSVLVKVLVSKDNEIRDEIIRATNNQTNVEISALHATDKIQRDIEDVLLRHGYYYERRTNYYASQGIESELIVTPLYIAAGFVALIERKPASATVLKSKFMRVQDTYDKIFSTKGSLEIWPNIAAILKKTDRILEKLRPNRKIYSDGFLKKWRYVVAVITVARLLKKYNYSKTEFINLDIDRYNESEINVTWTFLKNIENISIDSTRRVVGKDAEIIYKLAEEEFEINGIKIFEKNITSHKKQNSSIIVTEEFVETVNRLYPKQPWKPGIHTSIAKKLNCSQVDLFKAVNILIEEGKRFRQKDGILYDLQNNIVGFDSDRVDATTLKLK